MASFDEIRKKMNSRYADKVEEKKDPQKTTTTAATPAGGNSFSEIRSKMEGRYNPASSLTPDDITAFVRDADSFLGSAHSDYGSISPENATSVYSTRQQKASDLRKRAFAIRQYLDANKGRLAADKYDALVSYLDDYDKASNQTMMDFAAAMKNYETTGRSGLDAFNAEKQEKVQEEEDKTWWEKALASFAYTSDSTLPASGVTEAYHAYREDTTYREPDERWSDDQRNTFGYLYAINPERAYQYAIEVNNTFNAGEKQEKLDKISDSAKDNKVGHTLGALAASPLGLADYLSDLTESAARGTITQKSEVTPFEYSQTATGAIAQDLNEKGGTIDENVFILGGKGFGDVYSLGFSAAQSLISAYTLGGTGTLVAFIGMGGAAGVDDALARGATPDQALLYGSIVGAAEGAAEMISADNLLKIDSSKVLSKYLLAMLKQGLGESVEEGTTAIIENIADNIIMADKSNFNVAVEEYMKAGMTEEEAKKKAWTDMVGEVIYSAMGGFVTGAGNAAVVGGVQNTIQNAETKKVYGDSQQELVAEGLESDDGSESRKIAEKYQQKLDRGKNLSGAQLSRLVEANERQFVAEDVANIREAAETRLAELGERGNVSELAGILAKQVAGQKLTKTERRSLASSKYGQRVANELNADNIRSGEYTSGWAQKIDTQRINVDEYNRMVEAAQTVQEAQTPAEEQVVTEEENTVQAQELPATEADVEPVTEAEAVEDTAEVEEEAESPAVRLEDVSGKYGAQAGAMVHTYVAGQDVAKYDRAYGAAYDMGKSGVNLSYAMKSTATAYLSETQRELAYAAGKAASDSAAGEQAEKNAKAVSGKTGRKVGAVRGDGVSIADLRKSFNDTQGTAYRVLSTAAEATGIDIVLYKSEPGADGKFTAAQGKFKWSEDTIYIDVNAGLANVKSVNDLAKYAMLRTFSHEFTHFLEKWNPVRYNEFRRVVFDTLTERGEDVEYLIEQKRDQDESGKMDYDAASREVVAEAMTDILPDSTFVHTLAEKHKSIFDKLLERLKEFASDLKKYFSTLGSNHDRGANALKEQVGEAMKYLDRIVKLFDEVAVEAVENYQRTVATEEAAVSEAEQVDEAAETVDEVPTSEVETATEEDAGDSFTITDNHEFGTLEIKFDGKPAEAIREVLKALKFRWHGKKGIWYGKAERADIVRALREAYQTEDVTEKQETVTETTETVTETTETVTETTETVTETTETVGETTETATEKTASEKLADSLLAGYINEENINRTGKALTSKELYALADAAFGGTQAEGAYNRKDAYDAMELAVNQFLLGYAKKAHKSFNGTASGAVSTVEFMQDMLELLPTQNVRTQEMEDFQQFSTPPNIAYLAAWAANINASDFVLEPSAGIGGLAVFAKAWGAEVAVNELSKRRLEVLRAMGFDHLFNENAEQIDNILPDSISPSVVIMNPPFSSTAGRTANNKTSNAEKHIDQALARLRNGGRLVAVLGKSMNDTDYYRYWDKLRKSVSIRANLSIDGNNYKKYGTTWGVQIVVIDKTGPQVGETVTGRFTDLTEVPNVLEGIRNDRNTEIESAPVVTGGEGVAVTAGTVKGQDTVSDTAGVEDSRPAGNRGSRKRADSGRSGNTSQSGVGEQSAGVQNVDRGGGRDGAGSDILAEGAAEAAETSSDTPAAGQDGGIVSADDTMAGNDRGEPETERGELGAEPARPAEVEQSDDGVYATFIAPEIPINGGKKHPAVLVESAAMAAVSMPKATYKVKLPANVIKNNLSDAQLVTVTYAGQAHEQKLPDGRRKGFFVGDGTGVGKGRQIAGIILDNFMQGRTKAVWISKNNDLYGDAIRDWTATTGRSKDEVVSHNKIKSKDKISIKEGILYSTYDTLKSEKGGNRLEQIVEWLGEDFDGVIAFDEAHNMGNLFGKKGKFGKSKGSEKARAGVELQRRLPNARIVYVSATAATEVDNLAYAERIGLWGQGTAFTNAQDFISKIGASGLAAMELVIRDMKAMGTYVARSISYNGVNYDTVEHALNPMQVEIYNTMSRAWQKTMSNVQAALETTGGKYNSTERQRAMGNFYSGMQRFYNQVLTSMSMPSVIADMRRELDAGHSCVLQIVNTNEAQQNKQLAEAKANGESLDNLDLTPREALLGYLMNSFPTQMFEEYTDDDGNLRSRPVMDSAGNPVQNKEAIRQRDALVAEVNQMSIPDGPLEMLFDAFGPEAVAENTGRSRRVVPRKMSDGSITRVEERRTLNHRTADVQAFQDGKKRILVFSDAGGTGKSYHADRTEKNQQLRIHYVLQPGWVASNAVQGFGRTHRSNEASAPVYKLVTTNIKGQKRFTSTIARRLDQLGALTKGQRDTGSGMFGAKDNLETDLAKDSLREFYRRLGKGFIEDIDGMKTLDRLGLKEKFTDEFGAFKINDNLARDIGTFLNRILALEVDEQNVVFDAFISIYEMELEAAIQSGTLDTGMENVKADKIEVLDDKVIRQDKNTGSETHYIQAKTYKKPKVVTTVDEMAKRRDGFVGLYKTENGNIRAVYRIADKTTEWGAIQKQFRLVGPNIGAKTNVWDERTLGAKAEAVDKADWQKEWDAEVARVPEYNEDTLHMLTGALLPIWNSLPQEGNTKVKRLIAHDGSTYLGRVIDKDLIDNVLDHFSVDRTREVFTAEQVMDKAISSGVRFYLTNNRMEIFRSRVSGEWRLEITQPYNTWYLKKMYPDLIQERIQYRDRYFIPTGEKGIAILEKMLLDNPVRNATDDTEQYQSRAYLSEGKYSYEWFAKKPDMALTAVDDRVKHSRADIVSLALKNAASVGYTNQNGNAVVHVNDIDTDVIVPKRSLVHGLDRRMNTQAPVLVQIGDVLKNAIRVNELNPRAEEIKNSYLLIGAARNQDGNLYIASFVVNKYSNEVSEIDVLYSANAKKESAALLPKIADMSATPTDSVISIAHLLEYVNSYFPDILPESVLRHFGYEARPEGELGKNVLYQQRTDTLTDRDVLALAAREIRVDNLSAGEQDALRIFRERLSRLEQLEEERAEQGRLYREQQFGKTPDRAEAEATLNRMRVLDSQISKANLEVLDVEDKKVLRAVLQKARKVVEAEERAHGQEMLARWRDRRNNAAAIKKYRERLRGDVDDLTNWVLHPDNKDIVKRIPDALKNSVIPFLSSINFMSKQSLRGKKGNTKADELFLENMKKLNAALKNNIDINGLYSGYNDLPPNFMDNLQRFIASTEALVKKSSGEFIINKMTAEELQELSKVVRTLKKYIMQVNRFHYNAMYQHVYEAGDNTIETLKEMDAAKGTGKISEFLLWQQIRPAYAFERFGEGGKSIYDGLRRGQAQLAFNTQKIKEFADKTYTAAEVRAWEKELKTFYVGGDKLQIPVSTIMSIYRLSKDPEARYHMEGDGFRVATYTHDGKKISDVGHRFTTGEINQIIRALTPRQRDVADQLQGFMAEQGGKWGNYVSVARFGEELFTNKNYFPINSDGRHLAGNTDEEHPQAAALYALLNMSFTKSRKEKAKNRIVVYSIFDVFANHMASMAQYNAMALPILDAVKWFHYQQVWIDEEGNKEVIGNVREQMARVYGVPEETRPGKGNAGYAVAFVENIIKAFNGTEAQGIPTDTAGLNMLRRYNMAQVAYNFRVVLQQPLAITRAALLVDYASIVRGLKLSPAAIKKNIEEMQKYSGIAAWKSLGFYDVNISRGLTHIIKHDTTFGEKLGDVGMWGAEKADLLTWAAMWSAAKEEVIRKQKIRPESDVFFEEVTKLFEDIIYKTQVVDSILTKNEYMRSKGFYSRTLGSFMSEPTTTASMLIDAYDKYQSDLQRGMDRRQAWENNRQNIVRLVYVYSISAIMLAAVQAIGDAWRDDDDYQTFLEKWLEAFGGNLLDELMPLNKLPYLNQGWELVKELVSVGGWDTYGQIANLPMAEMAANFIKGVQILHDLFTGKDTNYTLYGGAYKILQAAAGLTGLPMAAATRELVAAWNSTVGSFAPSLKIKSYEPSEMANIKYAYEDGYLTAEEATAELLEKGLVDNEDEAYFTIAGWEAGVGYSRYDAMYNAIRNGGNVNEALAELTSHGYTEEEVFSQVKGQIGKWYRDGEISKAQVTEMLTKYSHHFGMDSDEITATVNKWSAKVVTGIDYNDIGDEYKAGKITASRAIEMYMRYGGLTREEAQQKVTLIDFVKEHPTLEGISYAAVESYKEHAEGAGIDAETFYEVWQYNAEAQADVDKNGKAISGSKKEKVLAYIHSLSLTRAQKDSLYYAFGWAQSKINEAPWR